MGGGDVCGWTGGRELEAVVLCWGVCVWVGLGWVGGGTHDGASPPKKKEFTMKGENTYIYIYIHVYICIFIIILYSIHIGHTPTRTRGVVQGDVLEAQGQAEEDRPGGLPP